MYEGLIKRLQDFAAGTMRDQDAQLALDAGGAIEALSYMHQLDTAEIVRLRRQVEAEKELTEEIICGTASPASRGIRKKGERMTHKQYSDINRCIGKLEGIGVAVLEIAAAYYFDTLEVLCAIIEELSPKEDLV